MMAAPRITVLCGGLGGARVALALLAAGLDDHVCFVTNVGDDLEVDGRLVCPDTDAVMYALAGIFDEDRGWGIRGDRFGARGSDQYEWFQVGERDRAHQEERVALLADGLSLGEATARQAERLGVRAAVIPVSDNPVRTRVLTAAGALGWQEWLVRDSARAVPTGVEYVGSAEATASRGALDAIRRTEMVLVAPSSPVASIGPMLAVPGVSEALVASGAVVCSPMVARRAPVLERDVRRQRARGALLRAVGVSHDPVGVAGWYGSVARVFVLDPDDAQDAAAVRELGIEPLVAPGPLDDVDGLRVLISQRLVPESRGVGLEAQAPGGSG